MQEIDKLWYLKNLYMFEGLPEEEIMKLASSVDEVSYTKDEMIYREDDPLSSIYVVKRGEVRLYHEKNGKRNVFEVLGPGSMFGGIRLGAEISTHFAQATHPTRVCVFSEQDFMKVIQSRPDMMLRFMRKLTDKIQDYEARLASRHDTAEELIMAELMRLQESRARSLFGRFRSPGVHITHESLAELTGLNRVTVTRLLKRLREQGRIKSSSAGIEILK